jgi:hypothetical protein
MHRLCSRLLFQLGSRIPQVSPDYRFGLGFNCAHGQVFPAALYEMCENSDVVRVRSLQASCSLLS